MKHIVFMQRQGYADLQTIACPDLSSAAGMIDNIMTLHGWAGSHHIRYVSAGLQGQTLAGLQDVARSMAALDEGAAPDGLVWALCSDNVVRHAYYDADRGEVEGWAALELGDGHGHVRTWLHRDRIPMTPVVSGQPGWMPIIRAALSDRQMENFVQQTDAGRFACLECGVVRPAGSLSRYNGIAICDLCFGRRRRKLREHHAAHGDAMEFLATSGERRVVRV